MFRRQKSCQSFFFYFEIQKRKSQHHRNKIKSTRFFSSKKRPKKSFSFCLWNISDKHKFATKSFPVTVHNQIKLHTITPSAMLCVCVPITPFHPHRHLDYILQKANRNLYRLLTPVARLLSPPIFAVCKRIFGHISIWKVFIEFLFAPTCDANTLCSESNVFKILLLLVFSNTISHLMAYFDMFFSVHFW